MYRLLGLIALVVMLCPEVALALVNINSASFGQLDALPGVGEVTANKILTRRDQSGAFQNIAEVCALVGTNGVSVTTQTCKNIEAAIYFGPLGEPIIEVVEQEDNVTTEVVEKSSSSGGGDKTVREPVSGLTVTAPSVGYVGQLLKFDIEPKDGTKGRLVRYSWNFGDGEISEEKNPRHQYSYPGTYVVVVESYFQKETKLLRQELTILPLEVTLSASVGGGVEVTNRGKHELDLSGMILSGNVDFVFPKNTILLAGKSMMVRAVSGPSVSLKDEFGTLLTTGAKPTVAANQILRSTVRTATPSIVPVAEASVEPPLSTSTTPTVTSNVTAASGVPENTWSYLGLLGVIAVGFLALFGSKRS